MIKMLPVTDYFFTCAILKCKLPVGYMDKEMCRAGFCDLFLKNCGSARPVLLLLDNHESRYSYNVLKAAKDNEVSIKKNMSHKHH